VLGVTVNSWAFAGGGCPPGRMEREGGKHDDTVVSSPTVDNVFLLFGLVFVSGPRF